MTNTITYSRHLKRAESESSKQSEDISQTTANPVEENPNESEVKSAALLSVIGKACFACITSSYKSKNICNSIAPSLNISNKTSSTSQIVDQEQSNVILEEPTKPLPAPPNSPSYSDIMETDKDEFEEKMQDDEVSVEQGRCQTIQREHRLRNIIKNHVHGEQVAAGWPSWLSLYASEAIHGWIPRDVETFEKFGMIGRGVHGDVYKARDKLTGKLVALKKVRFDFMMRESVVSMVEEIVILRNLNHPNIIKLKGLATLKMSPSLYLIFEYIEQDADSITPHPGMKFTLPQVKHFVRQLLLGLEHCHSRMVFHRNIDCSNLLIDINKGILKIAGFGFACFSDPYHQKRIMLPTSKRFTAPVYRAPEFLLNAPYNGVGLDLWSTGCVLVEMLAGKPIFCGCDCTEFEQLEKIFKICGLPSEEYWKNLQLPEPEPRSVYKRRIAHTFRDFPPLSLPLIETLLAFDPAERQNATAALKNGFFTTNTHTFKSSTLPQYSSSKKMNAGLRSHKSSSLYDGVDVIRTASSYYLASCASFEKFLEEQQIEKELKQLEDFKEKLILFARTFQVHDSDEE